MNLQKFMVYLAMCISAIDFAKSKMFHSCSITAKQKSILAENFARRVIPPEAHNILGYEDIIPLRYDFYKQNLANTTSLKFPLTAYRHKKSLPPGNYARDEGFYIFYHCHWMPEF